MTNTNISARRHPQSAKTAPQKTQWKAQGPIIPAANVQGSALMAVIAIMAFLACLTLGTVLMISNTAQSWQNQISQEITIQVKPVAGTDMTKTLQDVRKIALSFPGTSNATILSDEDTEKLLAPWLGTNFDMTELPVPRLVSVKIDTSNPPDFAAMRAALKARVPTAFLDDHRIWVNHLVEMARMTILIGLGVLALVFCAMIMTVVFATRGALTGNRHIVEVLHFVGAEADFVAREFQRHFFKISVKGAFIGSLPAAASFLLAAWWQSSAKATPQADQAEALFGSFSIGWGGYLGIAATMLFIALLTTFTARFTVLRTIEEIDRARSIPGLPDGL